MDDYSYLIEVMRGYLSSDEWNKATGLLRTGGGRILLGAYVSDEGWASGLEVQTTKWYLCSEGLLAITGGVEKVIGPIDFSAEPKNDHTDYLLRKMAKIFYNQYKDTAYRNHPSFLHVMREKIADITYKAPNG